MSSFPFFLSSRVILQLPVRNFQVKVKGPLKAMCSLAFFAFLRIGEITVTTSKNQPLQLHQLSQLYDTNNQVKGIKLQLENSNIITINSILV